MASPSILGALLLTIISLHSTAALPRNQALGPRSLDPTATPGDGPSIKNHPWHVYARFEDKICSGLIIHANWVMLLEACTTDIGINAESNIEIHAGVETSEEAAQVVKARVHPTSANPLKGITIVHLETGLIFDDKVQSAPLPNNAYYTFNGYVGVAAGFSTNGSADIRLQAFSAKFYSLNAGKQLFATGNSSWPTEDNHTRGTDYLRMVYYQDEDGFKMYCMVGARKSTNNEKSLLVEYHPIDRMMVWFADNLGLIVDPNELSCGHLVNKLR